MQALVGHLENIRHHPNADRLDLVDFVAGDFRKTLVTGKHYVEGQRGFYISVGQVVPDEVAHEMELYGKLGGENRDLVEAKNMRGVMSEGIFYGEMGKHWNDEWREGDTIIWQYAFERYFDPDIFKGA